MLRASPGKTAVQRSVLSDRLVYFLVEVIAEAMFAGTATLSSADASNEIALCRRLHNTDLPRSKESDQVAVDAPKIRKQRGTLLRPCTSILIRRALETLRIVYISGFYA